MCAYCVCLGTLPSAQVGELEEDGGYSVGIAPSHAKPTGGIEPKSPGTRRALVSLAVTVVALVQW